MIGDSNNKTNFLHKLFKKINQKKNFRLGMTALIISNEEMDDVLKIVKYLEETK